MRLYRFAVRKVYGLPAQCTHFLLLRAAGPYKFACGSAVLSYLLFGFSGGIFE